MARIDKYIRYFEEHGFEAQKIDNRSGIFRKGTFYFCGELKLDNTFEITETNELVDLHRIISHINAARKLKNRDLISSKTFAAIIDGINKGQVNAISSLTSIFIGVGKITIKLMNGKSKSSFDANSFKYLLSVLPKPSRQEFIADLTEIIKDMEQENKSKYYIRLVVISLICSVFYHAIFFKLQDYFYPSSQQSKRE